jgi:ABC-type proline/glycine betaine transport system ATPase subunit
VDVTLRHVTHVFENYGDRRVALDDISLHVPSGQLAVIVALPWHGRTTLMRVLGGDLSPTSGEVRIGEKPPAEPNFGWLGIPEWFSSLPRRYPDLAFPSGASLRWKLGWVYPEHRPVALGPLADGHGDNQEWVRLARENATTAILITWVGSGLSLLADRVVILRRGRVAVDLEREAYVHLLKSPKETVLKSGLYLGIWSLERQRLPQHSGT